MYCRNCGHPMHEEAVICVKCGAPSGKGKHFCPNCGAPTHEEALFCMNCGIPIPSKKDSVASNRHIEPRNLVMAIVLSLVTCGFYSIYWFIKLTDEINALSGNDRDHSGAICFLFSLLTCGIYSIYWAYRMGEKQDLMRDQRDSSALVYVLLSVFGLSIVVYALLQDAINKQLEQE